MVKKSNGSKHNGSGNGKDPKADNIAHFPTLAERDRARREQKKLEEAARKQAKKALKSEDPPFLNIGNITPFVKLLILAYLAVHIPAYLLFDAGERLKAFYMFGFIPGAFTGTFDFHWYTPLTIFTHMFIHGGWMHLVFNLVMTLALGIFFERAHSTRTTVIFFFLCGLAGAATYFVFSPFSTTPIIGASGGISGFFGAVMIMLHQQKQLGALSTSRFGRSPWPMIAFWIVFMFVIGIISGPDMAWQAHIGGFLAGVGLLRGLQKGKIRF